MTVTIDSSVLLGLYQAKTGVSTSTASSTAAASKKVAPTAPWLSQQTPTEISATVKKALSGTKLIDENAAKLDLAGASTDYRKLFALYQGLSTLSSVVETMSNKGLTSLDKSRINSTFTKGMAEIAAYVKGSAFDNLRLTQGEANTVAKATLKVPTKKTEYVTDPMTSSTSEPVAAFEGDVKFNISINRLNQDIEVPIDLTGMGGQTRTIGNVINFINQQLQDAGVETRFGTSRIAGQARTVQAGGKTITLPAGSDQWAMKITAGTAETVSLSAPQTAGAVYMAQTVGDPDPDRNPSTNDGVLQNQVLKFQTDTTDVAAPPQTAGEAYWVDGRVYADTLGPEVKTVHAQAVGPDGSVYMLADVTKTTGDQAIKGTQDVALLKYDSAGKLIYTRTLGAAGSATGLALAVSNDGKIAVAGSVTGTLSGATDGPLNSGTSGAYAGLSDSFVTLYNADGEEMWTQRRGARQEDEASQVAFGADGAVYVTGRSRSAMPGADVVGGWDSYVEGFKADTSGKVQTLFTQAFGTEGSDKPEGLVVDGNALVTASIEDGHAILRRFDISSGQPVLQSTRDLGDLEGGDIAGISISNGKVIIAGSTTNASLSAGSVSRGHSGGIDAFVASVSANLTPTASDHLAYYGGAGDDRATALSVANGQVWIAGSATGDLPDQEKLGTKDGFLTNINVDTGAIDWSRRFTGKDGRVAPTAIAVDPTGSSVLDRLGLPTGELGVADSDQLTALSALRSGDQFTVAVGSSTSTVTIDATDTLDTLAQKIRRASGFQAKVTITTVDGERQLKIEPINPRSLVTLGPGKADRDALKVLGLPEGVVRETVTKDGTTTPADGKAAIYGLGLPSALNLSDKDQINHTVAELAAAMGVIRTAYKAMVTAATPKSQQAAAAAAASGKVPTYLTNQISNYQAALDRLTGGSS